MNCHARVRRDSPLLQPVRDSYASGRPIPWVRIHRLPDYVYFNHQAHVTAGVSCVSCHGRVDQMTEVRQMQPLSMAWCLECHRNPEPYLRPRDQVTNMDWAPPADPKARAALAKDLRAKYQVNPNTDCVTCHR